MVCVPKVRSDLKFSQQKLSLDCRILPYPRARAALCWVGGKVKLGEVHQSLEMCVFLENNLLTMSVLLAHEMSQRRRARINTEQANHVKMSLRLKGEAALRAEGPQRATNYRAIKGLPINCNDINW